MIYGRKGGLSKLELSIWLILKGHELAELIVVVAKLGNLASNMEKFS